MKKLHFLTIIVLLVSLLGTSVSFAASPVQEAALDYFSGGTKNIAAADVFENLNDGDESNDPFILSVRSEEHYDQAHVPSAVWMDAKTVFTTENLAELPMDKQIVVYCYTGQTASQVTSGLRMLGYDAYNMTFGFSAWTTNPDAFVNRFTPEKHANDFRVDMETHEATETYDMPEPLAADVAAALDTYFSGGTKNMQAPDLFENLNDGDDTNDPFILSVRSEEDYGKGHLPGAVWMDVKTLFEEENLAKLPSDKQVVVYCYTGQTASQVTSALRALGYDAYNMLFGTSAWTTDPDVFVKRFNPAVHANDFRLEGAVTEGAAEEAPAAEAAEEEAAEEPATLPTTGGVPGLPLWEVGMALSALGAVSGYVALRRRSR